MTITKLDHRNPLLAKERRLRAIASYCKDLQQDIKDGCRSVNSGSDLFNILENIISLIEDELP